MVEKTPEDDVRSEVGEREGVAGVTTERAGHWRVTEVGLAVVYLISFAAVGLCVGSGHAPVAAVGGIGLLVAILVCVLSAVRGQLVSSFVLMALILWLMVLKDPQGAAYAAQQLSANEGPFIDVTE